MIPKPHGLSRQRHTRLGGLALTLTLLALAAPAAQARDVYVANSGADAVTVIDTGTGQIVGGPIATGDNSSGVAITPNGTRVYVTNNLSDTVSVIDTASRAVVGEPIAVGDAPRGVAISPDGTRVYVANYLSDTVSVIDTASGTTVGDPIPVGTQPFGIAITPDGTRLYVANDQGSSVSVIDTASNTTVGSPITLGSNATGVAISPDGTRAYVSGWAPPTISVIDTATLALVGEPISVGAAPLGVAFVPDGGRAYVASNGADTVSTIDAASLAVVGEPLTVGSGPLGIAIVPNQPPLASLAPGSGTAGQSIQLNASASHDPDGQIARYDWSFGDGATALNAGPTPAHTYSAGGDYTVTVTLTDSEGCSTSLVFTGLTASCNGSALARATSTLRVAAQPPDKPQPPRGAPSNVVRLGKLQRDKRRGTATLKVRVPGAGTLVLRGKRVRTVKRTVGSATTVALVVRAKRDQLDALKRRGQLKVRARITFRPTGGAARSVVKELKLLRRTSAAIKDKS